MRIEPRQLQAISQAATRTAAPASGGGAAAGVSKPDGLRLSDEGARARRVQAAAADAPEVRSDKVTDLKAQIQAGTYQVDTAALAEKLVDVV